MSLPLDFSRTCFQHFTSIHEFNKDAVMRCIIPYHQSVVFVRMIQNMKLKGTIWEFLSMSQETGYPPKRDFLVAQCITHRKVLEFICESMKAFIDNRISHKVASGFYSAFILELLSTSKSQESIIRDIWTYIVYGLSSQDEDYQTTSHMVLTASCWKISMNSELLRLALEIMITNALSTLHSNVLLALVIVLQNLKIEDESKIESIIGEYITEPALKALLEWGDLSSILDNFAERSYDISRLVHFILVSFCSIDFHALTFKHYMQIVEKVPIGNCVSRFVYKLLSSYDPKKYNKTNKQGDSDDEESDHDEEENSCQDKTMSLIQMLDIKYPEEFDAGVDRLLTDHSGNQEWKSLFVNSRHHPVQGDTEVTTLQASLKSRHSNIKKNALSTLLSLVSEEQLSGLSSLAEKTIVEYLSSDDAEIILFTLGIPDLISYVDAYLLFTQLELLLNNEFEDLQTQRDIKRLSLSWIIKFNDHPELSEKVVGILLINLLDKNDQTRADTIAMAKSLQFSLLSGLDGNDKKKRRSRDTTNTNTIDIGRIITVLSSNIDSHWDEYKPLLQTMLYENHTSVLAVLLFNCLIVKGTRPLVYFELLMPALLSDLTQFDKNMKPIVLPLSEVPGILVDKSKKVHWLVRHHKNNGQYFFILSEVLKNMLLELKKIKYTKQQDSILNQLFEIFSAFNENTFVEHACMLLEQFTSSEAMLNFLVKFWTQPIPADQNTSSLLALRLTKDKLGSFKMTPTLLDILIPSLFCPLMHSSSDIRAITLECLDAVLNHIKSTKKNEHLVKCLQCISSHGKELFNSPNYIIDLFGIFLSDTRTSKQNATLLTHFLKIAITSSNYYFLYQQLLILKNVSHVLKGELTLDTLTSILTLVKTIQDVKEKTIDSTTFPTIWDCKLLEELVALYSADTIDLVKSSEPYFELLIQILDTNFEMSYLDSTGKESYHFSLQASTLSCITQDFLDALSRSQQKRILDSLCNIFVHPKHTVRDLAKSIIKNVRLDSSIIKEELIICSGGSIEEKLSPTRNKRRKMAEKKNDEVSKAYPISKLIVLLEMMQFKDISIADYIKYIGPLFSLIAKFIDDDHPLATDPSREYIEQLVLLTLTSATQQISEDNNKSEDTMEIEGESVTISDQELKAIGKSYDVDVLIEFMRIRNNPTIHNKALLLLSYIAKVFPSKVLSNITSIFSFMGTTSSRAEDNYTYDVITKAIDRIIPALLSQPKEEKNRVSASELLSIFVSQLANIPQHRRMLLFTHILTKVLRRGYLPMVIGLLLNKHFISSALDDETSKLTNFKGFSAYQFALNLCLNLSPSECISSIFYLIHWLCGTTEYSNKSPLDRVKDLKETNKVGLRNVLLNYSFDLITSKSFLNRIVDHTPTEKEEMQKCYYNLFESLLLFTKHITSKPHSDKACQKADLKLLYSLIDEVNHLLTTKSFFAVIESLMKQDDFIVKKRALNLFNEKIKQYAKDKSYWKNNTRSSKFAQGFLEFAKKLFENVKEENFSMNMQSAALMVEIVSRVFGHIEEHTAMILDLTGLVADSIHSFVEMKGPHKENDIKVQCSMVICIASVTQSLGVSILPLLNKFFPDIIKTLAVSVDEDQEVDHKSLLQISCLESIKAIVSCVPKFLSQYWSTLLITLVSPKFSRSSQWSLVQNIVHDISIVGNPRTLVDPLINTLSVLKDQLDNKESLLLLINISGNVANGVDISTMQNIYKNLLVLYLDYFEHLITIDNIEQKKTIENETIDSFMKYVMKMNGHIFNDVFICLTEWSRISEFSSDRQLSSEEISDVLLSERTLLFYRLFDSLGKNLRGESVRYYKYVFGNMCLILSTVLSVKKGDTLVVQKSRLIHDLICVIMSALKRLMVLDDTGFIDKKKFDKLSPLLVDQVDLIHIAEGPSDYRERISKFVVPCLGQLVVYINNELLWKPLNKLTLIKVRSKSSEIRESCKEILEEYLRVMGHRWSEINVSRQEYDELGIKVEF